MAKSKTPQMVDTVDKVKPTKPKPLEPFKFPDISSALNNISNPAAPVPNTKPATPMPDTDPEPPAQKYDYPLIDYDQLMSDASSFYDNQYSDYSNKMKTDAEASKAQTSQQYGELLRQAYISNMQNQKKMSDNLAAAGIRGGGSETANLKLATGYQNTRYKTNADKQSAIAGIDKSMNNNIFNFKLQNEQAKNAYIQQLQSEARQQTMTRSEWEREDAKTAEERAYQDRIREEDYSYQDRTRQEGYEREDGVTKGDRDYQDKVRKEETANAEKQRKEQERSATYDAHYSTFKSVDSLKKALKNAKSATQKTAINKAIKALQGSQAENKLLNLQAKYGTSWSITNLKKALKKANDPVQKRVIRQRINYVQEYEKKNKKK